MAELVLAEAGPATAAAFDALNEARKRDRMVDAVYKTGTIIGLGSLLYFGWWIYDFSTNVQVNFRNEIGNAVNLEFPAVDRWLASDAALTDYADLLGVQIATAEQQGISSDWLTQLLTPGNAMKPQMLAASPDAEKLQKLKNFVDGQKDIDPDTGAFVGHTANYSAVMEAWVSLYDAGYVDTKPTIHPVDQISNFVVHNKWYWGGVLGLASVPALVLGAETMKELAKDYERRD